MFLHRNTLICIVSDALSKIPSVEAERDGAVKVQGHGDAEMYINGLRMQDNSEITVYDLHSAHHPYDSYEVIHKEKEQS